MSTVEFNQILVSNTDFLKPFAFSLTRDNELAKDLLQETMYRALLNGDKYNVGTNLKAWLYTIMRNIFINHYRRQARQKTVIDSSPNDYLINQTVVAGDDAESHIRYKELQKAVHQLPTIFKHPFMLYYEGYKYYEISEMLNEPLGTIKSRIHFARKLLKEKY